MIFLRRVTRVVCYPWSMGKKLAKFIWKNRAGLVVLGIIFLMIWFGRLIDPVALVESVGPNRALVLIFFLAIFGGVSTISSAPFYASIATFAAGGLDPIALILVAAPGLAVGDSLFYFAFRNLRDNFHEKAGGKVQRLVAWFSKQKPWAVNMGTYLYTGFSPFPGDILMLALALMKYPYKKFMPYVLLGNFSLVAILVYGGGTFLRRFVFGG